LKLFFIQIPSIISIELGSECQVSTGFRINYNFNTHQQREVEIIFIADQKRYGQLSKGDILLQINGKNVDSMTEKDLNKFVLNSNNPKNEPEFEIKYLTIYRPFIEDLLSQTDQLSNDDDAGSSSNQQHLDNHQNGNSSFDPNTNSSSTSNSPNNESTNGSINSQINIKKLTISTNHPQINPPISSSTPLRKLTNGSSHEDEDELKVVETNGHAKYEQEEIKIIKQNGAMGLSIVGGGNVACHPFGIDHPGIFISKIVPDGPASKTSLRVGDRILRVNGVDVQNLSHDETVDELKKNSLQVVLFVSHDPQPKGMQEIILKRSYPDETIGIRINGGIENKSANLYDSSDEGIFVVNIINGTIAHRDGRLQVGTRIMEVSF
jgi:hypothetical protein